MATPSTSGFQTAIGLAIDAVGTDDWANAHKQLAIAELHLNGLLVDSTTAEGVTNNLRKNLQGAREAVKDAMAQQDGNLFEIKERR